MKHTALLLAGVCLLLSVSASAQKYPLGKGNLRSGGGFNFTQLDNPDAKTYRFTVNPNLGYFVLDELLLGFNMNYSGTFGPEQYTGTLRFSPQVRYYYAINKSWFLVGDFYYNMDRQRKMLGGATELDDNSSISYGPGFDYFLTRRISCEGVLLYTNYLYPDAQHVNKLAFNFGFNIRLPIKRKDRLENLEIYKDTGNPYDRQGDEDLPDYVPTDR